MLMENSITRLTPKIFTDQKVILNQSLLTPDPGHTSLLLRMDKSSDSEAALPALESDTLIRTQLVLVGMSSTLPTLSRTSTLETTRFGWLTSITKSSRLLITLKDLNGLKLQENNPMSLLQRKVLYGQSTLTEKSGDGKEEKSLLKKSSAMLFMIGPTSQLNNSSELMLASTPKLSESKKTQEMLSLELVLLMVLRWVPNGPFLIQDLLILLCVLLATSGLPTVKLSHSELASKVLRDPWENLG